MLKQVFTNIKTNQEYILQEMVDELNRRDDDDGIQMYIKYKLDTRNRLEHFFGQCAVEAKTTKGDFTLEEELEKFTENNIISYRGKARLEEAKNYIRNIMIRQILQNGQNLLVTLCTLIVEKII